jgi:hypothetical protein
MEHCKIHHARNHERFAVEKLKFPQLASPYGGPLRANGAIQSGFTSETALNRVLIDLCPQDALLAIQMGRVAIQTDAKGLLPFLWLQFGQVLRRKFYLD